MNSADELMRSSQQSYDTSSPMSYSDWQSKAISSDLNTGDFWKDFWNGFTFLPSLLSGKYGKKNYQSYTDAFYNKQSIKNAAISEANSRAFENYMSSTAYQRAYKDISATGLNPAMLLNSAFGAASTPSSAAAFTRSSSNSRSSSESNNRSYSASAVLVAMIYILAHMI